MDTFFIAKTNQFNQVAVLKVVLILLQERKPY